MNEYNITSAQYIDAEGLGSPSVVKATIDGVEMTGPVNPANRHYAAILEWVADGNTIADAD